MIHFELHMTVLFRSSWYNYHTSFGFIEWIFVTGNYIFQSFYRYTPRVVVWMRSFDNRNHKLYFIGAETVSPIFCQILRISWQRSYCDAMRSLGDVTAMSRDTWRADRDPTARLLRCYSVLFPRRPHCACFEHVQNLAATSATLETLLWSAALPRRSMRSHNDPATISGDLADFADRSEVAVLCDWELMTLLVRRWSEIDINPHQEPVFIDVSLMSL